jgi:hypothetical protein
VGGTGGRVERSLFPFFAKEVTFCELSLITPTNEFDVGLFKLSSTKDCIEPTTGLRLI